jgi:adenosine 3'-phospho 5'-phosphosulfate transporter B2
VAGGNNLWGRIRIFLCKYDTFQMMFYVNAFSSFLCLVSLVQQMTLFSSVDFMLSHEGILRDCVLLSLGSALGQVWLIFN